MRSAIDTEASREMPARRRLRLPTSVVVTVFVAALSVWIAPALTRQWDDRQKARDVKVALAEEMSEATARVLGDGLGLAVAGGDVRPVLTRWDVAGLGVEAKLR